MDEAFAAVRLVRSRRAARQSALQALYQIEVGRADREEALASVLKRQTFHADTAAFVSELVLGVLFHERALDAMLAPLMAEGWDFARIAVTDRLALRLGAFELTHLPGVPPKVSINEAVELAKLFGSAESGRFVNGVLGRLLPTTPKANWDPAMSDQPDLEPEDPGVLEACDEVVHVDEAEFEEMRQAGAWTLRKSAEGLA